MRKLANKLASILLAGSLFFGGVGATVFAEEFERTGYNYLVEEPPMQGRDARGASAPGNNASVHNLSISAYNYQIQSVGYAVYTDKWLTGSSKMKVTVGDMRWIQQGTGAKQYSTTVTLWKKGALLNTQVASRQINTNSNYTFTGLDANAKYFVKFAVRNDGTTWTWNGTISS